MHIWNAKPSCMSSLKTIDVGMSIELVRCVQPGFKNTSLKREHELFSNLLPADLQTEHEIYIPVSFICWNVCNHSFITTISLLMILQCPSCRMSCGVMYCTVITCTVICNKIWKVARVAICVRLFFNICHTKMEKLFCLMKNSGLKILQLNLFRVLPKLDWSVLSHVTIMQKARTCMFLRLVYRKLKFSCVPRYWWLCAGKSVCMH